MTVTAVGRWPKSLLDLLVLIITYLFVFVCVPELQVRTMLLPTMAGLKLFVLSSAVITAAAAAPLRAFVTVTPDPSCTSLVSTLVWWMIGRLWWCVLLSLGPFPPTVAETIIMFVLLTPLVCRFLNMAVFRALSWLATPDCPVLDFRIVQFSATSILVTLDTLTLLTLIKRTGFSLLGSPAVVPTW